MCHVQELLISPKRLHDADIPFVKVVQYPGEMIINCPGAYHAGFNSGKPTSLSHCVSQAGVDPCFVDKSILGLYFIEIYSCGACFSGKP